MAKYQDVFNDMLDAHQALFHDFKLVHQEYLLDPTKYRKAFNEKGAEVLRVVRRYENILCGKSEGGKYSKFSSALSERFWNHIRVHFPKIDEVGMQ